MNEAPMHTRQHTVYSIRALPEGPAEMIVAIEEISNTYDSGYSDRGRPDYVTQSSLVITYFDDEEARTDWIVKAFEAKKKFRLIRIASVDLKIETKVTVQINPR